MRDEILAGPSSVQYKDFSHYYFQVGLRFAQLKRKPREKDDRDMLQETLRFAFAGPRYNELMNRALNVSDGQSDNTNYMLKLTDWELQLFRAGQEAAEDFHRWKLGDSWRIQPSALVRKNQYEDMGGGKRTKY